MESPQHDMSRCVAALGECKDMASVRDWFHNAFDEIGFSVSIYVRFHLAEYDQISSPTFSQKMVVSTTFPDEWQNRYREKNYHRIDPIFRHCRNRVTPQIWMDVSQETELEPLQKQMFSEAIECGMPNGIAVPIHGPKREFAVVSLSADEPAAEFMRRIHRHKHTAHVLAIHVHAAIQRLMEDEKADHRVKLTPRECECLKWTARGKSSWAISEILTLSERTVNFHLANAMHKLEVTSRTHAVAKSLHSGLIEI